MTEDIETLRQSVRAALRADFEFVQPQKADTRNVHLEVWKVRERDRFVGLEFPPGRVNFWVTTMNAPPEVPTSIDRADKMPKGRVWTDESGKGANSNLSAYDGFRGKKITHLGVKTEVDAKLVLNHLLR